MRRKGGADLQPISDNAALVLQAIRRGHGYGFDVMRVTALASGTMYPLLRRMEAQGLVRSRWEAATEAHGEGRPRRREYRLTAAGERALAEALPRMRARQRVFELVFGRGGSGATR
jgi:DNA-binding PadR family transcriptional regulator